MSSIVQLVGNVGPSGALRLKRELSELNELPRPSIRVDLHLVTSLHLGAVNGLVQAANTNARNAGQFQIVSPNAAELRHVLTTAGLSPWLT